MIAIYSLEIPHGESMSQKGINIRLENFAEMYSAYVEWT